MSEQNIWDILIVGGGPAGLSAAIAASERQNTKVLICEREEVLGGIPRHSDHTGWGTRDLRWNYSGPAYAKKLISLVQKSGPTIHIGTTILKIETKDDLHDVHTVSPQGIQIFRARVVIIATGCRESTRHSRLLPGKRPLGIFNTGALQQFVHSKGISPGTRAVILGSEHVSFSAVMTLKKAGIKIVAMIEPDAYTHSFSPVSWLFQKWYNFPVLLNNRIVGINGDSRVSSIKVEDMLTHQKNEIQCDTLIVSGDFTPEVTLAINSNLAIDPATKGVFIDSMLQTDRKGIYACGNVLHGAETGDIAALEGRWAGGNAIRYLDHQMFEAQKIRISCESPIAWISPGNILSPSQTVPAFLYTMHVNQRVRNAVVSARCNGEIIWKKNYGTLTPNRRIPVPVRNWKIPAGISSRDLIHLSIE
ncbi:MAG: NAD(P)/FAD-dependent oxidoreductase [Bacteroidetes bacterium]|nr:NAD(P)/FAD-dependent oxidoreductase [Bacteroidota bacterium]